MARKPGTAAVRPEHTAMVRNITATLRKAHPTDHEAGAAWYAEAQALARTLSPADPAVAAGVIASLSPMMPWGRNKALAVRAFADGQASGTLGGSVAKADRILNGEDPHAVLTSDKVRNFFLSILGDTDAVCVDRHAMEVAYGTRYADDARPALTPKQYKAVADAYREVARTENLPASAVQAITWVVWRRIHLTGTAYEHLLNG